MTFRADCRLKWEHNKRNNAQLFSQFVAKWRGKKNGDKLWMLDFCDMQESSVTTLTKIMLDFFLKLKLILKPPPVF